MESFEAEVSDGNGQEAQQVVCGILGLRSSGFPHLFPHLDCVGVSRHAALPNGKWLERYEIPNSFKAALALPKQAVAGSSPVARSRQVLEIRPSRCWNI
jgi:hypothetical protein